MINPPGTDSVYAMYDNQKIYVWYMQDICIYTILSLRYACEMYHTCLICMYVCMCDRCGLYGMFDISYEMSRHCELCVCFCSIHPKRKP